MRSLLGKIYKQPTATSQETLSPDQDQQRKQVPISYYNLREIEQKLEEIHQCFDITDINNSKILNTFEEVMSTLHGLLNVISQLKQDMQRNQQNLAEYEKLKNMVSKHSEIVTHLEHQSSLNLNRLYEEKKSLTEEYQSQLQQLRKELSAREQQLQTTRQKLSQEVERNLYISKELEQKKQQICKLDKQLKQQVRQIRQMSAVEDNTIKFEGSNKIYETNHVDINRIFIYSKLRKTIYGYIGVRDFCNLGLLSRQMHFICSKTFKKEFVPILLRTKDEFIQTVRKDVKEYQKIFDTFPTQNIRINAIKYLFFKIKPAAYMLPYFQEEQTTSKVVEQKSKLSQLSSFFRKKGDNQATKERNLTFESLKSDVDFKQIQKRVQAFFDKIFGIEAQTDLKNFNQIMKKQLHELKAEMKGSQKSLQLLCMSKYAYLQINQLNNLLQVCFALLLNKHNDLKDIKKKNNDLVENDKVLRNLVENIANDRGEVEKRIFLLQNEVLKSRNYEERVQQQLRTAKQAGALLKSQNEKMQAELGQLREQKQKQEATVRNWQRNWEEALGLIKQIPLNQ